MAGTGVNPAEHAAATDFEPRGNHVTGSQVAARGCERLASLPDRAWIAPRRGRRAGADNAAGAQGMAYAELAGLPGDHGALHECPLPGRLRRVRSFKDPGAGSRLVIGPDDRGDDPADRRGRRQPERRDRVRVDARAARRRDHDRRRNREARLRCRPAVQADADRLHERSRADDPRRPVTEAVRLLGDANGLIDEAQGIR